NRGLAQAWRILSGRLRREIGAQEKTRTSTPFRALAPEASASTSSATWAKNPRRYDWRSAKSIVATYAFKALQPSCIAAAVKATGTERLKWRLLSTAAP